MCMPTTSPGPAALRRHFAHSCSAVGEACGATGYDRALRDGDILVFGDERLEAIATPGHTPGHMALLWRDSVFTGDSLLIGGCGRTDFQQGDAGQLFDAITTRLFTLPESTLVYPGHDYQGRTFSSIAHERQVNPRLVGRSRDDFIALMGALNLPPPKMIDVAVPWNRRGGPPRQDLPSSPTDTDDG